MIPVLYALKDNAEGQLDSGINASALTIALNTGEGAEFPAIYRSTTTSGGSSTVLNKTGIGASGIEVGDFIENITDGSYAYVQVVNTDSLTTSELQGGSDNTWDSGDTYASGRFVVVLNSRNATTGAITASEKVLIGNRSGDTLTVETGGRGYDNSTAQSWATDDYVSLFVTSRYNIEVRKALSDMARQMDLRYTKAQVDALFTARNFKQAVRVATTAAGTLASDFENGDTIDGVVLAAGDRILIKDQVSTLENGIYTVNASGAPTRATDFDITSEVTSAVVGVTSGTSNADTVWLCTSDAPTVGTDPIVFTSLVVGLTKASTGEAQAGVEDTHYMTPSKTVDLLTALSRPIDVTTADYAANSTNVRKIWMRSDATTPTLKCVLQYKTGTWAASANLNSSKGSMGGFGTQDDAVAAGGYIATTYSVTEKYNGTAWSVSGNLSQSKESPGAAGTSSAGLVAGGLGFNAATPFSTTEHFNGTTWSAGGNLAGSKNKNGICGSQADAVSAGGATTALSTLLSITEEYNGSAWSSGGNLSQSKHSLPIVGTGSAAFAMGGTIGTGTTPITTTETYNGTAWSAGANLSASRYGNTGMGAQNAAVTVSGVAGTDSSITESYNGTAWSTLGNATVTNFYGAGAGTQAAGIKAGGGSRGVGAAHVSVSEKFTYADAYAVRTITQS